MFQPTLTIGPQQIGGEAPCFIIAELSCNHEGQLATALQLIDAAADAGANAVKIQTYTPETITRNFQQRAAGTIWQDQDLFALYGKAHTPWEWSQQLQQQAARVGLEFFSSPFDETAVDFLVDELQVPALKVASFEVVDSKLLQKLAATGLPILLSNGMTDRLELECAIRTLQAHGCTQLGLFHCNSGYPAAFAEANLRTMQAMHAWWRVPVGLSDHTLFADHQQFQHPLPTVTPLEAVRLGAKILEVHLTLDRTAGRQLFEQGAGGFDWPFSREPQELASLVQHIRHFEATGQISYTSVEEEQIAAGTHGAVRFSPTKKELASRHTRPSLWVVRDIRAGEPLHFAGEDKTGNVDSIRPAGGMDITFADAIHGQRATQDIAAGTPLAWEMVQYEV